MNTQKQRGTSIVELIIILALGGTIAYPTVSYVSKSFGDLTNMGQNEITNMVLENQCAEVDQRYIEIGELTKKNKQKPSATNLCGLD